MYFDVILIGRVPFVFWYVPDVCRHFLNFRTYPAQNARTYLHEGRPHTLRTGWGRTYLTSAQGRTKGLPAHTAGKSPRTYFRTHHPAHSTTF